MKSIIPGFNKFVFFEVTAKSFHQVSEVIRNDVRRLALSGWFYGEPLPRPDLNFPLPNCYALQQNLTSGDSFENFFSKEYLNSGNYAAINACLEELSIAKLKLLIRKEKYHSLCSELRDSQDLMKWEHCGPANLHSFLSPSQFWSRESDDLICTDLLPSTIAQLTNVFHSKRFYEFLEKITEFVILSQNTTKIFVSLRKYEHKSYILLKTNEANQADNRRDATDSGTVGMEDERDKPIIKEKGFSEFQRATNFEELEPFRNKLSESDEEDEGVTEKEIDIIYYCGEFDWEDSFGGQTIYTDVSGQQLLTVTPEANSMAIIVREKDVIPYVSYINCLSEQQSFFTFSITITGFDVGEQESD